MPKRFNSSVPRPQARRFRVSVPDADESVLVWIGAQSDFSASVRSLIREAIERHGYRDATCYPVQQQPRRGRPPKSTESTESTEQVALTVDEHPIPEQIAALVEPKPEPLMVPISHEDSHEATPDGPETLDVSGDSGDDDVTDSVINPLGNMEDVLGALR